MENLGFLTFPGVPLCHNQDKCAGRLGVEMCVSNGSGDNYQVNRLGSLCLLKWKRSMRSEKSADTQSYIFLPQVTPRPEYAVEKRQCEGL